MKIENYGNSKVGLRTARTQPPRMPQVSTPSVVKGAFGENVGRAIEGLGRVGEKIAGHLADMERDRQDMEVRRRETASMQEQQDLLFNQEEETVAINGEKVIRPKGLLLQELALADGGTSRFTQNYQDAYNSKLEGLSQYQKDKLEPFLARQFLSTQRQVITHEANQLDASNKIETEANLALRTQEAASIRDEERLAEAIDGAIEAAEPYYRKYDEKTREVLNEKITGDMIKATAVSILQSGDLASAQKLLDDSKGRIGEATYYNIKSTLDSGYKTIQANLEYIRKEKRIKSRFDFAEDIINDKIDWTNAAEIIKDVAQTDLKLAEAITKSFAEDKKFVPEEKKNDEFLGLAENMFKSDDPEKISNFILEAVSDKNVSRDRLAILVYAAKERVDELKKGKSKGFLQSIFSAIKKVPFSPLDQARVFSNIILKIQKGNFKEEQVVDVAKDEIKQQIKKNEPSLLFKDDVPNDIYDKDKGLSEVYSGDTVLKADEKVEGEPVLGNYTQEDLEWTAKKHGLTIEEVMTKLGIE